MLEGHGGAPAGVGGITRPFCTAAEVLRVERCGSQVPAPAPGHTRTSRCADLRWDHLVGGVFPAPRRAAEPRGCGAQGSRAQARRCSRLRHGSLHGTSGMRFRCTTLVDKAHTILRTSLGVTGPTGSGAHRGHKPTLVSACCVPTKARQLVLPPCPYLAGVANTMLVEIWLKPGRAAGRAASAAITWIWTKIERTIVQTTG